MWFTGLWSRKNYVDEKWADEYMKMFDGLAAWYLCFDQKNVTLHYLVGE